MNDLSPIETSGAVNIEAEQAVLGAILLNNEVLSALSFLEEADFDEQIHRTIFREAKGLIERGRPVTPMTLKTFLPDEDMGDMSVAQYTARLAVTAVPPSLAVGMGRLLRDHSACRKGSSDLFDLANAFLHRGASDSVTEIADAVIDSMMAVKAMVPRANGRSDSGAHVERFLSRVFEPRASRSAYVPLPLPEIGSVIQSKGWEPGNLYGLLAASGEGKTSLTLQIMRAAMEASHPTLLLSYDQQGEQVTMQLISQATGISMRAMSQFDPNDPNPTLSPKEREKVIIEGERIMTMPWHVISLRDEKIGQIAKIAARFVKGWAKSSRPDGTPWGTPLIVLDHNRKVTPDDPRAHEGRIAGAINGAGKAMAGELGAAVLFLNQRNGGGARRDVPRPIAADLFGGEQAREDYDAILYLYRPERWMKEKLKVAGSASEEDKIRARFRIGGREPEGLAEIGALKVRYGQDDVTEVLKWEGRCTRYASERSTGRELF